MRIHDADDNHHSWEGRPFVCPERRQQCHLVHALHCPPLSIASTFSKNDVQQLHFCLTFGLNIRQAGRTVLHQLAASKLRALFAIVE
jgi:hypothetical protein